MSKVEIYTQPGCGYCTHAKRLLTNKGIEFTEYDVYQKPENIKQMQARTSGRTYPQIFIAGKPIGGFIELISKSQNDLLSTLNNK
jgi:glutaredoxin 3